MEAPSPKLKICSLGWGGDGTMRSCAIVLGRFQVQEYAGRKIMENTLAMEKKAFGTISTHEQIVVNPKSVLVEVFPGC